MLSVSQTDEKWGRNALTSKKENIRIHNLYILNSYFAAFMSEDLLESNKSKKEKDRERARERVRERERERESGV